MTLNLRRDVPSDGENAWAHRRDLVVAAIREQAPDVLGTQEGLPHQLADLDARLPAYGRVGRDRHGDGSDEACALYYSRSRLRALAWGDLWLSDTPETAGSATWGNRHPRLVTWAKLQDVEDGSTTIFANTHLDHESHVARERGADLLASRLHGAVLMGDFNAIPGEPPHAILLSKGWKDAGEGTEARTFHGFTGHAWARLDWVLAPATHTVRSHRVRVQEGARHVSDHHPVVVDLERTAPPS